VIQVAVGNNINQQLVALLLNHTLLQHTRLFEFLTMEECVTLALRYTQVVSNEFLELPVLKQQQFLSVGFLPTSSIEEALRNYQQASKLLEETLLPVRVNP